MAAKSRHLMLAMLIFILAAIVMADDIIPDPMEEGSTRGKLEDGYYKDSFWPLDIMSIIGLVVLALMLVLATLGGVGGNGVIIPVCLIFFRFDPKAAVAHASIFAAIGSIGRIVYEKVTQATKKDSKSLTNYHLILMAGPPSVLGAFIGTTLNKMSSEAVIMILTFIVQVGVVYETFRMYQKKRAEESMVRGAYGTPNANASEPTDESQNDVTKSALRLSDLNSSSLQQPKTVQTAITLLDLLFFIVYVSLNPVFALLRGTSAMPSLIDNQECSSFDLYLLASYGGILLLLTFLVNEVILIRNVHCNKFYRAENDLPIDTKFSLKFIPVVLLVTTLGAYVSTGSSTLITLLLIWMGLSPFLASSTCLIIVAIFSGSSAAIYGLNGLIYWPCAIIGGVIVLLTTVVTRMTLYQSFLKHGKASLVILFISITMMITVPSNIYQVFPHIRQDYNAGKNIWAFLPFCAKN